MGPETPLDPSTHPTTLWAGAVASAALASLFAAADAAMTALGPRKIAALIEASDGSKRKRLERFLVDPNRVLARWLVARVVATTMAALLVGAALGSMHWVFAVIATLALYGTLAEIATVVSRARAARAGPTLLGVLYPLEIAAVPFAAPLAALGDVLRRWATPERVFEEESAAMETEVEALVEDAQKAGELAPEPAELIKNVLDFKDVTVKDVMIPRIKVVALEIETPLDEVRARVRAEGHSRYPVYAGRIDNVVGILHAKDLFRAIEQNDERAKLRDLVRAPANLVPESQAVITVLREMRAKRQHLAIALDEFGGVAGIVTLEDVLEEIVGEIRDEHDQEEAPVQELGEGRFLADASIALDDLSTYLGAELEAEGDVGSLGGLVTHEAGRVPAVGDVIVHGGFEFTIRERDAKRVIRVEIGPAPVPPAPSSAPTKATSIPPRASQSPPSSGSS